MSAESKGRTVAWRMNKLFHPNLKLLIVTEGSAGRRYYTKAFKGRVPGIKVKAVDTTGAGDAFVGGLLSSLASYLNLFLGRNGNEIRSFFWCCLAGG